MRQLLLSLVLIPIGFSSHAGTLAECQSVARENVKKCDDLLQSRHDASVLKLQSAADAAKSAGGYKPGALIGISGVDEDTAAWGAFKDQIKDLRDQCESACSGAGPSATAFLRSCQAHTDYATKGADSALASNAQTHNGLEQIATSTSDSDGGPTPASVSNAECGDDCQHPPVIQDAKAEQGQVQQVDATTSARQIQLNPSGTIRVSPANLCMEGAYRVYDGSISMDYYRKVLGCR